MHRVDSPRTRDRSTHDAASLSGAAFSRRRCSRPCAVRETKPARSRVCTCFDTPLNELGKRAARSPTLASPRERRQNAAARRIRDGAIDLIEPVLVGLPPSGTGPSPAPAITIIQALNHMVE